MFNSVCKMPSVLLASEECLISGRTLLRKENVNILADCLRTM